MMSGSETDMMSNSCSPEHSEDEMEPEPVQNELSIEQYVLIFSTNSPVLVFACGECFIALNN